MYGSKRSLSSLPTLIYTIKRKEWVYLNKTSLSLVVVGSGGSEPEWYIGEMTIAPSPPANPIPPPLVSFRTSERSDWQLLSRFGWALCALHFFPACLPQFRFPVQVLTSFYQLTRYVFCSIHIANKRDLRMQLILTTHGKLSFYNRVSFLFNWWLAWILHRHTGG